MFGAASQKPGGFSFGASNNTTNNMSTPPLNFSNNNSTNSGAKPAGFSFGNTGNTQQTSLNAGTTSNLGGNAVNRPAPALNFNNTNSGFSFGNNNATTANPTKPSLFGNSSTNPAFGGTLSGLGLGQSQSQFQPQSNMMQLGAQNTTHNASPYGINFMQNSTAEMPKALTSSSSEDNAFKLKRKRTNSESSSTGEKQNNKNISLVGRIVDSFKTPSKYSVESMSGLFTSTRKLANNQPVQHGANKSKSQLTNYSASLGLEIPKIPASKSEYRRLVIRNPRDAFLKYEEIDANSVLLAKRANCPFNSAESANPRPKSRKVIDELKPPSKRVKSNMNVNPDVTFSKPLFEQQKSKEVIGETEYSDQSHKTESKKENTESDYWCTPSISDLSKLSSLELTHVQNFSAGRKNHGNLMFKYPVDLTAFEGRWNNLLNKTIVFHNRILQVYPDEAEKPSQGNGLNVPAVITLENVFPKKYDPKQPNSELLERHIERLKSAHGMKFISFDPLTGNYVFEVEHFSIWGIVDEEDDDPEIVARWIKQQELEQNKEKRKNELQINALEKIAGYGQPGDNWKRQKPDFGIIPPGAIDFNEQENEIDDDMLIPNNAGDANDQDILPNGDDDAIQDASVPTGLSETNVANNEEGALALLKTSSNLNDIDDLVEIRAYEPEVKDVDMQFIRPKAELAISDNWDEQLDLSNGFFSVFNKNLDKRHNVKLDPKHVGELIFGDKDVSRLKKAVIEPPFNFDNSLQYQKCLQAEMFESEFTLRSNGLPQVVENPDVSLNIPLLSFENSSDYSFWELLSILYDDYYLNSFFSSQLLQECNSLRPKMGYIQGMKRKELLCVFLQKLILLDLESSFDSSVLSKDTLDKIYHFVCTDKLADAIQYAVNTRNNHIAVLLTMLDSNDSTVNKLAKSQLNVWSQESIGFIPSSVLKIYKLLAGDILSKDHIDHLEGLTWPVVLYLMIKYGDSNKSLSETIKEFVQYAEGTGISRFPIFETQFRILKMVNSSKEVLPTFDVELQFLLMKHLKKFVQFSPDELDSVIQKFAEKLEKKSMIEEASFVLEHLNNSEISKEKITVLFNNNVSNLGFLENDKKLKELHEMLHIPDTLLHEARAAEYSNLGKFYKSTLELILAGNLIKAHNLMLKEVAPQIIIRNVSNELDRLSRLVEKFSTLSVSKVGSAVYGDYIKMIALSGDMDYNSSDYNAKKEKLRSAFDSVLNGITSLADSNHTVKVAKTIMIKKLVSVAFKDDLNTDTEQLLRLELPESEKNYLEAQFDNSADKKLLTN